MNVTNEDRRRYLAAAQAQGSLTRNARSLRRSDRIVTTLAREGLLTCTKPQPRSHMVYALTPPANSASPTFPANRPRRAERRAQGDRHHEPTQPH